MRNSFLFDLLNLLIFFKRRIKLPISGCWKFLCFCRRWGRADECWYQKKHSLKIFHALSIGGIGNDAQEQRYIGFFWCIPEETYCITTLQLSITTLQLRKARFIQNAIWVVERRSCHLTLGFLFRNRRFWWLERVWTTILTNQKLLLVFRLRWPAQAANFDRRLQNWLRNRLRNLSYKYRSRPVFARDSLWCLSRFKRSEIIIFGTDMSLWSSRNLDFLF